MGQAAKIEREFRRRNAKRRKAIEKATPKEAAKDPVEQDDARMTPAEKVDASEVESFKRKIQAQIDETLDRAGVQGDDRKMVDGMIKLGGPAQDAVFDQAKLESIGVPKGRLKSLVRDGVLKSRRVTGQNGGERIIYFVNPDFRIAFDR